MQTRKEYYGKAWLFQEGPCEKDGWSGEGRIFYSAGHNWLVHFGGFDGQVGCRSGAGEAHGKELPQAVAQGTSTVSSMS